MRVLTLHRPWPALVVVNHPAAKSIENRTWDTLYRGPVAFHSGGTWDRTAETTAAAAGLPAGLVSFDRTDHPIGIHVVVDIVDVCDAALHGEPCQCGPWAVPGQRHWRLARARPVRHLAIPGHQGWWRIPDDAVVDV
jgi:hypothetical protein